MSEKHPGIGFGVDRAQNIMVFPLGEMMEQEARDALKAWKAVLTGGVYSVLVKRLSHGLLRARARSFEP
jgi:hypothetical protein